MMDEPAFLEELLSIPSLSGEEDAAVQWLVRQMTNLGFQAHRDEAGNGVGILGDPAAERSVVLLGHVDTVPGDIPVRQEAGLLYGRGAVDAKGPLAAFVLAAAQRLAGDHAGVQGDVERGLPAGAACHAQRRGACSPGRGSGGFLEPAGSARRRVQPGPATPL